MQDRSENPVEGNRNHDGSLPAQDTNHERNNEHHQLIDDTLYNALGQKPIQK